MEEIDLETIVNDTLNNNVDQETYNTVIEKIDSQPVSVSEASIDNTMNIFIIGGFMGILGLGYFMYGKKAEKIMAYISGLLLIVIPYFVYDLKYLVIISVVLLVLPFVVKV